MKQTFENLMNEFIDFSLHTFPAATPLSSLQKLKKEMGEVFTAILRKEANLAEEYVDCMMCVIDSAVRNGITPAQLKEAFASKLQVNKSRQWIRNDDNTYSHVKSFEQMDFYEQQVRAMEVVSDVGNFFMQSNADSFYTFIAAKDLQQVIKTLVMYGYTNLSQENPVYIYDEESPENNEHPMRIKYIKLKINRK